MDKIKERTCTSCGGKMDKSALLRWVNINGLIYPDWTQKIEGRSVYTHFDTKCIEAIFNRKLPSKFAENISGFALKKEDMQKFVHDQAKKSLLHFFSLAIKSGKLVKGQNLVIESLKKGKTFKYCFIASDISGRTFSEIEKSLSIPAKILKMNKSEFGSMIDGRPCGVAALVQSELSEKVSFYMDLVENFISGDINAHQ